MENFPEKNKEVSKKSEGFYDKFHEEVHEFRQDLSLYTREMQEFLEIGQQLLQQAKEYDELLSYCPRETQ